jgi:hypothetical protein
MLDPMISANFSSPRPPRGPSLAYRVALAVRLVALRWRLAARRAARTAADVLIECHRAQLQMTELRLHPDLYTDNGDRAPCTYADFLFRSPVTFWVEPTAGERAGGSPRQPFRCSTNPPA